MADLAIHIPTSTHDLTVCNLREEADRLLLASKSEATLKAYRSDWTAFESWATSVERIALPADTETVVLYLTALHESGKRISTIRRRVATISQAHQHAGHEPPTRDRRVRAVVQGIARTSNTSPKKKRAIGIAETHPAAALVAAWLIERGGHGTTADDLLQLSADKGIDLTALAGIARNANDRATRLALTAWIWSLSGERFGDHAVVGARAKNGWSIFNLIRGADVRSALVRPALEIAITENRNTDEE